MENKKEKDPKTAEKKENKTTLINTTTKEIVDRDTNPNPVLTPVEKKNFKKKRIIGIVVMSVILAIAIILTVLTYTVFKK